MTVLTVEKPMNAPADVLDIRQMNMLVEVLPDGQYVFGVEGSPTKDALFPMFFTVTLVDCEPGFVVDQLRPAPLYIRGEPVPHLGPVDMKSGEAVYRFRWVEDGYESGKFLFRLSVTRRLLAAARFDAGFRRVEGVPHITSLMLDDAVILALKARGYVLRWVKETSAD